MNRKTLLSCCIFTLFVFAAPELRAQSGTISGSPNPCEIYLIQNTCNVTITWSSLNVSFVQVWVANYAGESLFAYTSVGGPFSSDAPWITDQDVTFNLYDYSTGSRGALLASVTVRGERSLRCEPMQ